MFFLCTIDRVREHIYFPFNESFNLICVFLFCDFVMCMNLFVVLIVNMRRLSVLRKNFRTSLNYKKILIRHKKYVCLKKSWQQFKRSLISFLSSINISFFET